MRKVTFLSLCLLVMFGISAQTNLVQNPSFETWTSGVPDSWTVPANSSHAGSLTVVREQSIFKSGTSALRMEVGTTQNPGFQQIIPITAGKTYTLSMRYYVVSGDGTDARIWSSFKNATGFYNTAAWTAAVAADPNIQIKLQGDGTSTSNYFTIANGTWGTYSVEFKAPADVTDFVLEGRVYKSSTVIWDDFSLVELVANTPTIDVNPTTLSFSSNVNVESAVQTVTVTGSNLTAVPTYTVTGTDAAMFTATGTLTTAGGTINVKFLPTGLGEKTATLEVVGNGITKSIALSGTGTSPGTDSQTFTFKNGLEPWTQYSVTGDQVWVSDPSYGAKMSGYSGGAVVNEDWLISPAFDLSGTVTSASVTFGHAINYIEPADFPTNCTFWISTNYTSGAPSTATWTQLTIPTYPASKGWTFVNSGTINAPASAIGNSNVRVAFKYTSDATAAATWGITDFIAMVNRPAGVDNAKSIPLTVFGGNGKIVFESVTGNTVEVYNAMGQRIYSNLTVDGLNTITVNAKGLLVVKVGYRTGKVVL